MAKKYPWAKKAKDDSDNAHCSLCQQDIGEAPKTSKVCIL